MRRRRTCRVLPSGRRARPGSRSRAWSTRACSNILNNTDFTRRCPRIGAPNRQAMRPGQAGCMAKTERRKHAAKLPGQVEEAVRAAGDKKAIDVVVLDLRKAAGFTDFFLICSGTNPRQI